MLSKKNILVRSCRSVFGAFWHGVGLVPDNVRPEVPAVTSESQSQQPRDPDQILALDPSVLDMPRVAVADIQPEGAVVFQDSGYFPEGFHQLAGVFLRRAFGSELIGCSVVSGVVVGW